MDVTKAHTITEAGFLRRLTLLTDSALSLLQIRSFWWLTYCSTLNLISSMKTKFGGVTSGMRSRMFCDLSSQMLSCFLGSSCLCCILYEEVWRPSVRLRRIVVALIPTSRANFKAARRWFFFNFPSYFYHILSSDCSFCIQTWSIACFPVSLNIFYYLTNRFTENITLFHDGGITVAIRVESYNRVSINRHFLSNIN